MKRLTTLVAAAAFFSVVAFVYFTNRPISEEERMQQSPAYLLAQEAKAQGIKKIKKRDEKGIKPAISYLGEMLGNEVTGKVELSDVHRARKQMYMQRSNPNARASAIGLVWEDQGPDNVGGRTRGFLIDKNNPDHIITGGVAGGLFFSNDAALSWQPHPANEEMGHSGISTIRQASNGDIYVGTGESFAISYGVPVSFGAPGFVGEGIYKSTDGGQTFNQLPSTNPVDNTDTDAWSFVNEIAIDPNNPQKVYAATNGGLKVSTDGGATWTAPTGIATPVNASSNEVVVTSNGTVLMEANSKYYRSTDGLSFTNLTGTGGFVPSNIGRMEFAVSPQDGNYIYTVISDASDGGRLRAILLSTDGGVNWTSIINSNSQSFNVLGEQGFWNIALGVDPLNKERIFVGGQLELWSYESGGWNQVAYWIPDDASNPYYVHADMHGVFFHPTNSDIMYVVSDGGVFKTLNSSQQFPSFKMRNKGYTVTQFYGAAASDAGYLMGGAQDNGTQLIDLGGNTRKAAIEVSGGDGGDCEFSINPNAMFASTYFARVYRSSNGGNSFSPFYDNNCDRDLNNEIDQGALFLLPTFLWEQDNSDTLILAGDTTIIEDFRSVYFVGASTKLWFTPDALNFSSQPYWYEVEANGTVSEIEVSPDGMIFFGTTSGNLYSVEGLASKYLPIDTITYSTSKRKIIYGTDFPKPSRITVTNPDGWDFPSNANTYKGLTRQTIARPWANSRYLTGIGVDPNNNNSLVVTLGNYGNTNYVYHTANATSATPTWVSIQNNLPLMPVFDAVIDYYNPGNIILGTELGIWASSDMGASWTEENTGMASVPVFKVFQRKLYDADCMVLYIGTHARGIFRTTTLTKNGCSVIAGIKDNQPASPVSRMEIYPNPVNDKAIVEFEVKDANAPVNLLIVDLLGRMHRNEKLMNLRPGANKIEVPFDDIAAGIYMVTLRSGKTTETKRVVVTK